MKGCNCSRGPTVQQTVADTAWLLIPQLRKTEVDHVSDTQLFERAALRNGFCLTQPGSLMGHSTLCKPGDH